MKHWFALEGSPSPLGVSWIAREQAFNFALYSTHAGAVTLLLYGVAGPPDLADDSPRQAPTIVIQSTPRNSLLTGPSRA